ncbi:DNA-directed RNA polymerase I and III 14 KDA polypeptide [Talaromyces stipitatus ATCC 10500]|uniref:DNA-directed RNA polymerases I and III subunit RPAC2 n=1 Tax=Talaromyces stipitatus (strain ATCC 10500 / CBS 375.48 / QM 6759 / NRRL 1006) TaxID=441959 RepID=B8MSM4_TALSN|nr:DNA-directed RNA polymerase I and III 14 KDA polypeptide [Talaromyces stipitatus ATCC 10500]EED12461.1 DNA-directed RNA polymerase I and III 14 KDA polypeptide [Talaromyces stipitatus ATCC 10500]
MPASVHEDQDQSMVDVDQAHENGETVIEHGENRITILSGATETAASFQFKEEGHTLGNALRYVIMKNPAVEFCGYTIPHPSEAKMNLRIQTYENTTAIEALEKGLDDLMDLCDVVTDKFTVARDSFNAERADQMTA